jgi:hypothetical protein
LTAFWAAALVGLFGLLFGLAFFPDLVAFVGLVFAVFTFTFVAFACVRLATGFLIFLAAVRAGALPAFVGFADFPTLVERDLVLATVRFAGFDGVVFADFVGFVERVFFALVFRILADAGERLLFALVVRLLINTSLAENELAPGSVPAFTPV